jgi:hypothetical protein
MKWNKDVVYAELSQPPNNWSKATIDRNMFQEFPSIKNTKMNQTSIMMYPFPARWTLDGQATPRNTTLSDVDKAFVREVYPPGAV